MNKNEMTQGYYWGERNTDLFILKIGGSAPFLTWRVVERVTENSFFSIGLLDFKIEEFNIIGKIEIPNF